MIKRDSFFLNIPKNIDKRQIFLLEGIRFCFESIFLNYLTLQNELEYISTNPLREQSHALIFKEAWQQIDTTHRLTNLISSLALYNEDNKNKKDSDFEFLKEVKPFRNTFQHLDERIDEFMLDLNAPLWGSISWLMVKDDNHINSFILSIGHPREDFESQIINPAGKIIEHKIDRITLESIQKNKNDTIVKIDLSSLYSKTERLIKQLELQFKDQIIELTDQLDKEILLQDTLLCLEFKVS